MKMVHQLSVVALLFVTAVHAQKTYIPDDGFEQRLIDLGHDSGVLDDSVLTANINTITSLGLGAAGIVDLTGIEDFTNVKTLDCSSNMLTTLDLSNNVLLEHLNCKINQLTSIDVSYHSGLKALECAENELTTLDLTNNINLKILGCIDNQLTSINTTNNALLESILCNSNQLSSLDVSNNTNLEVLGCASNLLSNIDVSSNTLLTHFYCSHNQITSIDVSANTALEVLDSYENQLTSIDLSQNLNLTEFSCHVNNISDLNLANGNNLNMIRLVTLDNPNLYCIQVDDKDYSIDNWNATSSMGYFNIDGLSGFSEDCSEPIGLEEEEVLKTNAAYPNPARLSLHLDSPNNGTYAIYTIQGNEMVQHGHLKPGKNTIPLTPLNNGMYLLKTNTNSGQVRTQKIIKH